MIIVWQY